MTKKKGMICGISGCKRKIRAIGLCEAHYRRQRLYGEAYADIPLGKSSVTLLERRERLAVPVGFKPCLACKLVKPLASFPRDKSRARGRHPYCKVCSRDKRLQRTYGTTNQDYEMLLKQQSGCCALCGAEQPGGNNKHFDIDHDHETGVVRGLLCSYCNYRLVGAVEQRLKKQGVSVTRLFAYLNGAYALKR